MARSSLRVLIRGAGELASGVALRLFRCGFPVLLTELPEPLTVRRPVSFSDAVYTGQTWVEGVEARRAEGFRHALSIQDQGAIPVLVDPEGQLQALYHPSIVVDAATRTARPLARIEDALLVIGVGPTFEIGVDAHYAIETRQGRLLGRVYDGDHLPGATTGLDSDGDQAPGALVAPISGAFRPFVKIGDRVEAGQIVAEIEGRSIDAGLGGLVRGLVWPNIKVEAGRRIGDIDPAGLPDTIRIPSDRALAVAGGVLEAIVRFFGPPSRS